MEFEASAELLMITHEYEEYRPVGSAWTWFIILFVTAATLAWAMVTHMAVPNAPRHWDFDVLPDTPALSPYATVPPPQAHPAPVQMDPAPYPKSGGPQQP